ncbi:PQQ-binding-like beta-propeller repeat protein [Haloglomus litoreum]|uniref:outer membrane protein assembly factor BamB family protein n=1 Tax=Haloglomus litoreum TaxID=3034026 RepID=UPI0023E8F67E|nr:PQQ-binding-like beta-propeller repeat protein [Haloglomus sp. DT116]
MPTRRAFLQGAAAASLAATAGCFGRDGTVTYRSYGYGTRNRGSDGATGPTDDVEVAWRAENALEVGTPAVVDGQVLAAVDRAEGSAVVALEAESGDRAWTYEVENGLDGWHPAAVDGMCYFVDRAGTAHAVATDDGTGEWERSLDMEQSAINSPVVVDGALVVGLGRQALFEFGGLYALETEDGSVRWHRALESGEGRNNTHTPAYPAALGGTVYYASFPAQGAPQVAAVSAADGSAEWTATPTDGRPYTGVAVTEDRFYLGGPQGHAALDRAGRDPVWQSDRGGLYVPPTVVGDEAYVLTAGEEDIQIRALTADGSERWSHERSGDGAPGAPTVADGTVYYGAPDGHLYALDTGSGDERWRFGEGTTGFRTPAVVDGTVYVASDRGLVALRAT